MNPPRLLPALVLASLPVFGQTSCPEQRLVPSDSSSYLKAGSAVAISGDTLIVGAPKHSGLGIYAGAVYIYERLAGVWTESSILFASDGEAGDAFGQSLAIDGDRIVVGAIKDDDRGVNAGAVYVFERASGLWTQTRKLTVLSGNANDQFGTSVDVEGDLIIGSAPYYDVPHSNAGSVFVFERLGSSWFQRYRIEAFDAEVEDRFGWDCAITGDWILVGSPWDDDAGPNSGSAYAFLRNLNVWDQRTKMLPAPGRAATQFGRSIACTDRWCAVGSEFDSTNATSAGAVTMHERQGAFWAPREQLLPIELLPGDHFGVDVAIDGNLLAVGADSRGRGEVFLYEHDGTEWLQFNGHKAPDNQTQGFGVALALQAYELIVGAPNSDHGITNTGATFKIQIDGLMRTFGEGLAGTGGFVPTLSASGCAAEGGQVRLSIDQGLGGTVGVLLIARSSMVFPLSGGTLYLTPPFVVNLPVFLTAGVAGEGTYVLNSQPFSAGMSGIKFVCQAGFLDAGAIQNIAFTPAVEIKFR